MKYRKLPVEIEAFRIGFDSAPDWFTDRVTDKTITLLPDSEAGHGHETMCDIHTLEGVMRGDHGDYIIKGVKGEIYPCKPDIFEKTYEPAV